MKARTKTKALLEKINELVEVTVELILLNKTGQFFGINDQVQATNSSKSEFLLLNASSVDLFPNLDVVCLSSAFNSSLVIFKMNQGSCKLGPVRNAGEEDLRSLMVSLSVSLVTLFLDVGNVGTSQEVF